MQVLKKTYVDSNLCVFGNLIAALLKREPKDRPSLDSILRRGFIQKVSSWLTEGPPRSVLPSISKSARRKRGGSEDSVSTKKIQENADQDQASGRGPKQVMKDMKKGDQATFQIQKAENESPVKVKPKQKSGKQRPTMELARDKRVHNPKFFKFDSAQNVNENYPNNQKSTKSETKHLSDMKF